MQTKPASAFETGTRGSSGRLAAGSAGGWILPSQIRPRKPKREAWLSLRTPGLRVSEGAPKKPCAKSWRADAPGLGCFVYGHLQMGVGINPPCLPLARPKPRVPLGAVQDARRGCLQWRSDDRWRAGRAGAPAGARAARRPPE